MKSASQQDWAGEVYVASHILIACDENDLAASRAARVQAEILLALVERDPSRFSDFARIYSACPSAERGGSLGAISPQIAPHPLERVLRRLTPRTIHDEIVQTNCGFHILRLDNIIPSNVS